MNSQLFIDHRRRRPLNIQHSTFNIKNSTFNIQHSTFNIIKAYEKEFLGSRDSHSDSGTDGGTDRTGNDLVHGLWAILILTPRGRFYPRAEPQRAQSDAQRICIIKELVRMPGDEVPWHLYIINVRARKKIRYNDGGLKNISYLCEEIANKYYRYATNTLQEQQCNQEFP